MKKWLIRLMIIFIPLLAWIIHFLATPLHINKSDLAIEIEPGSSLKAIAFQLVDEKILNEPWRFILLSKALGQSTKLRPGNYNLNPNITPYQLLKSFVEGRATEGSITFIEGQDFNSMLDKIKANDNIKKTMKSYDTKAIASAIGIPYESVEGQFFPDTYYFSRNTSDIEILKRAYKAMQKKLNYEWARRAEEVPYKNSYEALTMASIIEKETGKSIEANLISGVFIHRLSIKMKLQSDPTVIYGLGKKFTGDLTKKDLLTDTPYNTYTREGLPPAPITMPGLISIRAALHPTKTEALYFVGKGDGTHYFSANLSEHNSAVRKYQIK
ncbi:endolytic transglycosylase MltG [Candidatus Methylopumilus planktonicus]|uniref:endolytic transglycosylase MltG n=1 Tax=Candidatus Methylopumilus planktonicus TaxID=1581557 RepID=UPI0011201DDD|nr:endolytic transglycosylase MltG [Candidatus Methylopumilus planktonicus]QDD10948.1 endolytic transglycosylase MltG [Candidatus Methylopumilus planktonicus]QDD23418.1 endolytic transglycosylase MltG [Candidatus Methylopumilus planktonicus]